MARRRYQLTADGLRIALFFSRTYARLLRPKLAEITPRTRFADTRLKKSLAQPLTPIYICDLIYHNRREYILCANADHDYFVPLNLPYRCNHAG